MNTAHHTPASAGPIAGMMPPDEQWSALADGEVTADELDALLQTLEREEAPHATCERYQLIGEALRAGASSIPGVAPHVFVAGVRARLETEPARFPVVLAPVPPQVRGSAANEAVFRWKLLAGLASVTAVVAVSWGVIGGAPAASGGTVAGPQLALMGPAGTPPAAGAAALGAVVVQTAQGPVLRDARLEELLAEHRQYGGMSALQMPAGFLRDATFQNAPQR